MCSDECCLRGQLYGRIGVRVCEHRSARLVYGDNYIIADRWRRRRLGVWTGSGRPAVDDSSIACDLARGWPGKGRRYIRNVPRRFTVIPRITNV